MKDNVISFCDHKKDVDTRGKMLEFIDSQIEADPVAVQPLSQSLFTEIDALLMAADEAKAAAELIEM